jgi:hypothetical protein
MTANIPKIQVYNKKNPVNAIPGMAGKIAVIGAFDSEETEPLFINDLDAAYTQLGTDTTFNGVKVLDKLFYGASGIIAVNITTKTGSTVDKSIITTKLTTALAKIKKESFDMLFIADTLTDEFMPIITAFTDDRYLNKLPIGYVGCVTTTSETCAATAALQSDACYGIITQAVTVNGTAYDLLETAAYYCGVIASTNIGSSMTAKQVPGVTALTTSHTFEDGDLGKTLVGLGYTVLNCYDRENSIYEVVNSEQFNGYDLYINRVRDYVIRELALHQFLGERNRTATYSEIQQEVDRVKAKCVKTLDLLADIEYNIVRKNSKCVDINITKLLFDDIIIDIDVYVTIEVQ